MASKETQTITSKESLLLDLPPSCVQFSPNHPEYLVVGTYNLEKDDATADASTTEAKKPQSRNGSLVLFRIGQDESITHIQTIVHPSALLDLRFHTSEAAQGILAVVSSTGTLSIFKLDPVQDSSSPLQHIATSRCEDVGEDILFLQCQWHPSNPRLIGVTTSTGSARVLQLDEEWKIMSSADLDIENSLEAWSIAFAPSAESANEPSTIYVGGDDSMLRYNSYANHFENENNGPLTLDAEYGPQAISGKHDAGVTAILPLSLHDPNGGRLVLTGSYDDHVRLLSIHDLHASYGMKRVKSLVEENLGGGVWRFDLVDVESSPTSEAVRIIVLTSCMHAGARLIEIRSEDGHEWTCNVLARFEEHKSMNYGSTFRLETREGRRTMLCISTSFYDRLFCLWRVDIE